MNTIFDKENRLIAEIHSKQGSTEPAEASWKSLYRRRLPNNNSPMKKESDSNYN